MAMSTACMCISNRCAHSHIGSYSMCVSWHARAKCACECMSVLHTGVYHACALATRVYHTRIHVILAHVILLHTRDSLIHSPGSCLRSCESLIFSHQSFPVGRLRQRANFQSHALHRIPPPQLQKLCVCR